MAWRGSFSRSLMSASRASSFRSSPPLRRLRPPPSSSRRFTNPRTIGELGCVQSLLPLHNIVRLTSHLTVNAREFCELSHGIFRRSCQDR